jgi:hypothetical protein
MPQPIPIEWWVEGLIAKQAVIMLYGLPGHYKSMCAMDMGMCLAAGETWLLGEDGEGGFDTEQAKVLWLDLDQGEDVMNERLIAMKAAHDAQGDGFRYVSFPRRGLNLGDERDQDKLVDLVKYLGVDVLFIDTFRRVSGNISENDAEIDRVLGGCRWIIGQTGCSIVLLHHANKNPDASGQGRIRGNTAIAAGIDLGLYLENQTDGYGETTVKVKAEKTRRYSPKPFGFAVRSMWDDSGAMTYLKLEAREITSPKERTKATDSEMLDGLAAWVQARNDAGKKPTKRKCCLWLQDKYNLTEWDSRNVMDKAVVKGIIRNMGSDKRHQYVVEFLNETPDDCSIDIM